MSHELWAPVPPVDTVLIVTQTLRAKKHSLSPGTLVRVVSHLDLDMFGPSIGLMPVNKEHPMIREKCPEEIIVFNRDIHTYTRPR